MGELRLLKLYSDCGIYINFTMVVEILKFVIKKTDLFVLTFLSCVDSADISTVGIYCSL